MNTQVTGQRNHKLLLTARREKNTHPKIYQAKKKKVF
jgi:hypothetical protein